MRWWLRASSAICVLAALSVPGVARATDMSGLVVIVAGMFVGIPAALLLAIAIGVSLVARASARPAGWHRAFARTMLFVAPLLGVVYPVSLLLFDGRTKFLGVAFLFDAPVLLLALAAWVLAWVVARRPLNPSVDSRPA